MCDAFRKRSDRRSFVFVATFLVFSSMSAIKACQEKVQGIDSGRIDKLFSRKNRVAWCIVPFDSKRRGPEERAEMLERLGFTRFAYDWRDEHVASFDAEIDALSRRGIALQAFWVPNAQLGPRNGEDPRPASQAQDPNAIVGVARHGRGYRRAWPASQTS